MSECYADMAGGDCNCPMCKYTETPEAKDAIKVGRIVRDQHQEITRLKAELAAAHQEIAALKGDAEPVACPHKNLPEGCYRVRCQLGKKCVEPLHPTPNASAEMERDAANKGDTK